MLTKKIVLVVLVIIAFFSIYNGISKQLLISLII
jgi:preprotein translocase subunit SecE